VSRAVVLIGLCCAACGGSDAASSDAGADGARGDADAADAAAPDTAGASAAGVLFINEVMPSNTAACSDALGEFDDWVELYNAGDADLDLAGFTVTDDAALPTKAVLPAGVVVPAHGTLLLWADGQVQGVDHLSFKLDAAGEAFAIFAPDGAPIDAMTFAAATTDVSFARLPDGTGAFAPCARATCGALNGAACAAVP